MRGGIPPAFFQVGACARRVNVFGGYAGVFRTFLTGNLVVIIDVMI
jgi:hypothetical protein